MIARYGPVQYQINKGRDCLPRVFATGMLADSLRMASAQFLGKLRPDFSVAQTTEKE